MDTINHQSMFSERGEAFTAVSYPDFEVLRPFQQLSDTIIDFYLFQVRKLFLADTIILSAGFNRDLELAFQKGGAVPAERTRLDRIGTARFSVNSPIKNDEIVVCSPSNLTSQQQTNTLRDVSPTGPTRTAPKQAFVSSPTTSDETEFDKTNLAPSPAVSVDSLPGLSQLGDWYKNTNVPINKTSISDDNQSLRSTFLFEEDDRFTTISTSDEPSSEFSSSPGSSESGLISSLPSSLTRLASRELDDLEAAIALCCAAATRDGFVLHRDSSQMGVVE
ncbi:unnamed protein product, partial [Tilletia caries]